MNPKISYLLDDNKRLDVFYQFQQQDNLINDKEYFLLEHISIIKISVSTKSLLI